MFKLLGALWRENSSKTCKTTVSIDGMVISIWCKAKGNKNSHNFKKSFQNVIHAWKEVASIYKRENKTMRNLKELLAVTRVRR
jgi:hypothetical protein